MRFTTKILLAGAGATSLAGAAFAADRAMHPRQAPLADRGDPSGIVEFVPVGPAPVAMIGVADDPVFADMQRMMAEMDARMTAMMRAAAAMPANGGNSAGAPGMVVSINGAPAGSVSYSFVSTSTGPNGCTRTVEMSADGKDSQPKVVRTSAGDCGTDAPDTSAAARTVSAPQPARPAPVPKPDRRDTI